MKYTAYIDGSHHDKSQTSGWGFAIFKNEKLIHEFFGSVPDQWKLSFEYYAFAKLVQFCLENKLNNILMKTDLLGMEKQYKGSTEIVKEAQKYIPTIPDGNINLVAQYISRKENAVADKLSRLYLMNLYQKERDKFLKVHGELGSKKVNFLHMPELLHSSKTMLKSAESKVLHAVKRHHLIFDLMKESEGYTLRIMWNKTKDVFDILESVALGEDFKAPLMEVLYSYSKKEKKIMLALSDKDFFHQLASIKENKLNFHLKEMYKNTVNNLDELFLHNTNIYPVYKKKPKKRNMTFTNPVQIQSPELKPLVMEKAKSQNKFFKIVMGWDIKEFTEKNKRKPSDEERSDLAQKRKQILGI